MNKYQKIISQIINCDIKYSRVTGGFRINRILLKDAIRIEKLNFEDLIKYKNFAMEQNIMFKSFKDSLNIN